MIFVGRRQGSEEDCMGKLGISLFTEGERGFGNQGFSEIQLCLSRKMALEFVSPPRRFVGSSFGLKIWRMEELG